jgi:hypothetical protein
MRPAPALPRRHVFSRALARPSLFAVLALSCAWMSACGAPGAPTPPKPILPKPVKDLAAHQQGGSVILTFTLPKESTEGDPLAEPPAIEIFRGEGAPGGEGKLTTRLVYTVPSALVDTYLQDGQIEFRDPLEPASMTGQEIIYMVRTRASRKRASADSNVVSARVFPVPAAPTEIRVTVTEPAVELTWTAPARNPAFTGIMSYRVYRAELAPGTAIPQNLSDLSQAKLTSPLELLGPAPSTNFRDTHFTFDSTYIYVIRSVTDQHGQPVESADSAPTLVTPKDTFPPAAPQRLVAVFIQATEQSPAHVELSWDISSEPDLAGYRIYRSEQPDTPGQRLNTELLLTPTFRDMTALQGKRYTYRVSAVDRSGNESILSTPVTIEVPQ